MRRSILRRGFLGGGAAAALPVAAPAAPAPGRAGAAFNVREFGAAGDGARPDTRALQAAIDACAAAGGGSVYFPAGAYLSGTLFLKSNVRLFLDPAATLLGSRNLRDYPETVPAFRSYTDNYTDKSLLYGENLENISIEGRGTLDGQGAAFEGPYKVRPYMIRLIACRNITVSGVTMRDSPMWVQHYLACDGVSIHGLTVHSRVNRNNDGIDIDCCERVRISDCDISSGDDAIVLKSTAARPCRNVAVTNCVLSTACNALKLGTETNGGFENIAISNCTIYDTRLAGIALEIVDGGALDRVNISNIAMQRVGAPIFIRLGDRARPFVEGGPRQPPGSLRNVMISGVQAVAAGRTGCAVAGLPEHPIEHLSLENIRLSFEGGGKGADPLIEVSENPDKYPEHSMFGPLPAYGFYCRHVRDLSIRNVRLGLEHPDERAALICDDVDGLDLAGCHLHADARSPLVLRNVKEAFLHGCRAGSVRIAGNRTGRITIRGNELGPGGQAVEIAPDVPRGSVSAEARRS